MPDSRIDRGRVRTYFRALRGEDRLVLLEHAIEMLTDEDLATLVDGHLASEDLLPSAPPLGLVEEAEAFRRASLAGDFLGNPAKERRLSPPLARRAQAWIAECHRLLRESIGAAESRRDSEALQTFEIVFDLLRTIDDCRIEIVDLGDETSLHEVHVAWRSVLPAYFGVLARSVEPEAYASAVLRVVRDFVRGDSDHFLRTALALADEAQRLVLRRRTPRS